jgi:FUN14 domain-containing protein 1
MGADREATLKQILKDLSKAPPQKQMAVGAGSGWLCGYLAMKAGKSLAATVGGTLLLLQVLNL